MNHRLREFRGRKEQIVNHKSKIVDRDAIAFGRNDLDILFENRLVEEPVNN